MHPKHQGQPLDTAPIAPKPVRRASSQQHPRSEHLQLVPRGSSARVTGLRGRPDCGGAGVAANVGQQRDFTSLRPSRVALINSADSLRPIARLLHC